MVAVKALREGSHSTNVKLCKASGGGEGMMDGRRGVNGCNKLAVALGPKFDGR